MANFLDGLLGPLRVMLRGVELTRRRNINLMSGFTATDNPIQNRTDVVATGTGGGVEVHDNGVVMPAEPGINFVGFDLTDDPGGGVTTIAPVTAERTPLSLALQQVNKQDPSVAIGPQPAALITLNDDMSVTTLTRFTFIDEAIVPTISSNLFHINYPGGGAATNLVMPQEGSDITMPQFFASIRVDSITHTGADTNGAENVSVGIAKDESNFILVAWQRKRAPFGYISVQVKIGGVQNLRGEIALSADLVQPFELGLSCVANSLTAWQKPNGGTWTKITSWALTEINLKTTSLTGWKPAFRTNCDNVVQATFSLTNFKFGRFGAMSMRDISCFANEDSTPYLPSGDTVYLTATATDPQGENYCGVFSFNLVTYALAQTGVIMISRGGAKQNDVGAHVVYYTDTSSKLWINSWGGQAAAADVQVYYKANAAGTPDLKTIGSYVIAAAQLTLPTTAAGGCYDAHAVKVGGTWYLAYVIGPNASNSNYPALASTTDLTTYAAVASDPVSVLFEGCRIVYLNGAYYITAVSNAAVNVYDLSLNYLSNTLNPVASFRHLTANSGAAPAHFELVPHGSYIYLLTFDNALNSGVANNWGNFRELRSPRYEIVLP